MEYTYNSNAIEGNTLTLRETDLVLHGLMIAQKPLKDHMEAVGHKEAFDFVSEPVQPYLIEPKVEQLLHDFTESAEQIVTKLARFHIEFEDIHPFIDGNVTQRHQQKAA